MNLAQYINYVNILIREKITVVKDAIVSDSITAIEILNNSK